MEKRNLNEFKDGWLVGDFVPAILRTKVLEIGVKNYLAGQEPDAHYHKEAIEYTLVLEGEVQVNGEKFIKDDIIVIRPDEVTLFKSLTDSSILCIKIPSVLGDKYVVDEKSFNLHSDV